MKRIGINEAFRALVERIARLFGSRRARTADPARADLQARPAPRHPQHPSIVDAPPERYGRAFVIGAARVGLPAQPNVVELARLHDGHNLRDVQLVLRADGGIEVSTCDSGDAPWKIFGHEDYEFEVSISPENVPRLAWALLRERLTGDLDATDTVAKFCKDSGIDYEWSSDPCTPSA